MVLLKLVGFEALNAHLDQSKSIFCPFEGKKVFSIKHAHTLQSDYVPAAITAVYLSEM